MCEFIKLNVKTSFLAGLIAFSKERTKETAPLPAGGAYGTTPSASGTHNLVSAKGDTLL